MCKMKKAAFFWLIPILCLTLSVQAKAAVKEDPSPTVTFDGSSSLKYSGARLDDFGDAFHGMVPGEERMQDIILKNSSSYSATFYMETEVIKTLEESKKASGAGYGFALRVTYDGKTETIYGGADGEAAWIGGNEKGLADVNEELKKYGENGIAVATVEAGKQAVISLELTLDGRTMGNDYQLASGTIEYDFHAVYEKPETVKPTKTPTVTKVSYIASSVVKTGDETPVLVYLAAATLGLGVVIILWKKKKLM